MPKNDFFCQEIVGRPRILFVRMRNTWLVALLFLVPASFAQVPSNARIGEILADRINVQKRSVGISVGVIDGSGRRVVSDGKLSKEGGPVDGDTVFEIGSVTKVFTALLLADMVEKGELRFDDPVGMHLPKEVTVPEAITLEHLVTHMSGLPRMPSNSSPADPSNPYADYTVDQMYEFLTGLTPARGPGEKYEYSNLGGGLLGHILGLRAGVDYETLVQARIAEPLAMESTAITLSDELRARLALGHSNDLKQVSNWDIPTFAGAGALRSTVNDMLSFVGANIGLVDTSLAPAMRALLETRHETGMKGLEIARGWHIFKGENEVIWHNGGTGGYRSFVGFSPSAKVGVVVLSNSSVGVDDLGRHLLDQKTPLMEAARERTEITLEPEVLERYVGRYQLAPNFVLTITREEDRLFSQATGQGRAPIFPESETEFFLKVVEARLTFEVDAEHRVTRLVLHQGGQTVPAKRIED